MEWKDDAKVIGHYGDGTPNHVPNVVPPHPLNTDDQTHFATWMYRGLDKLTPRWEIIDTRPRTVEEAKASIKRQCAGWGIPFRKRQWAIVKTNTHVTRSLVED